MESLVFIPNWKCLELEAGVDSWSPSIPLALKRYGALLAVFLLAVFAQQLMGFNICNQTYNPAVAFEAFPAMGESEGRRLLSYPPSLIYWLGVSVRRPSGCGDRMCPLYTVCCVCATDRPFVFIRDTGLTKELDIARFRAQVLYCSQGTVILFVTLLCFEAVFARLQELLFLIRWRLVVLAKL